MGLAPQIRRFWPLPLWFGIVPPGAIFEQLADAFVPAVLPRARRLADRRVLPGQWLDFARADTDWDVVATVRDGASIPLNANRALIAAKHRLRHRFALLTGARATED